MKRFSLNLRSIFVVTCLATLSACGGKLVSTPSGTEPGSEAEKNSEIETALNNSQAICDGQACHSSVSMVLSRTNTDIKPCTGYLLSADLMVTTASCIPVDLRQNDQNCSQRIYTYLPQTNVYAAEAIECESIKMISPADNNGKPQNFAILKLSRTTKRPPFFHRRSGIREQDDLTLFQVNTQFNGKQYIGRFQKNKCRAVFNSLATNDFIQPISRRFSVSNCDLVEGGEGAPILSDSEHVVGMVETTLNGRSEKSRLEKLGFRFIEETPDNLTRGINYSCLQLTPSEKISTHCNDVPVDSTAPNTIPMSKDLRDALNLRMRNYNSSIDPRYFWDMAPLSASSSEAEALSPGVHGSATTHLFYSIPRCVSNMGALAREISRKIKTKEDMRISLSLPVFRVQIGLDSLFRPSSKIDDSVSLIPADFQYSPATWANGGDSPAPLNLLKNGQVLLNYSLSRSCPL